MSAIKINGTWKQVSSIKVKKNGVWQEHSAIYARLEGAWHLIDLSAEQQDPAYHVWKAYADDESGSGISLTPTNKKYIGFATGKRSETVDISDPTVFDWSLIKGEDGKDVDENVLKDILDTQNLYSPLLDRVDTHLAGADQAFSNAEAANNQAVQAAQNALNMLDSTASARDEALSAKDSAIISAGLADKARGAAVISSTLAEGYAAAALVSKNTAVDAAGNAEFSASSAATAATNADGSAQAALTAETKAAANAAAAVTAQTKADGSAQAALTAESNASKAAVAADGSAKASETSARSAVAASTSADGSAKAALAAETQAKGYALDADGHATASKTSALAAATAATNADGSASAALTAKSDTFTYKGQAVTAKEGAETAKGEAETAALASKTSAQAAATAATNADGSASAALTAKSDTFTYKGQAVTAKEGAETAKGEAETAAERSRLEAEAAVTANTTAEGHASAAISASSSSSTYSSAASAAKDAAEQAKLDAETAKAGAETAKTDAETAKTGADSAEQKAEQARIAANAAKSGAESSMLAAETAKDGADSAKNAAVTAKNQAVTAKDDAETAKVGADSAKNQAVAAKGQADSARDAAVTAKNQAVTAKGGAESARDSAFRYKETARIEAGAAIEAATQAGRSAEILQSVNLSRSNIVTRGLFSNDLSRGGWTTGSVVRTDNEAIPKLTGRPYVLKLTVRDSYDLDAMFPISVGDKIYISAWVYTTKTNVSFNIGFRMAHRGLVQNSWPAAKSVSDRSGNWVYVEATYTHGTSAYDGAVPFLQLGGSGTMPPVYISDINYSRNSHRMALAEVQDTSRAYIDEQTNVLKAERVIKADANGKVSGIHLLAEGSGAEAGGKMFFQADEIAIVPPNWNPNTETDATSFPFYFSEDRKYMYLDEAVIRRLSAESIDSGALVVDGLSLMTNDLSLPAGVIKGDMIDPSFKDGIVRVNPDAEVLGGTKNADFRGLTGNKTLTLAAIKSGGSAHTINVRIVGPNLAGRHFVSFRVAVYVNNVVVPFAGGDTYKTVQTYVDDLSGGEPGVPTQWRSSMSFNAEIVTGNRAENSSYTYELRLTSFSSDSPEYSSKISASIGASEPTKSSGGFITDVRWSEIKNKPSLVTSDRVKTNVPAGAKFTDTNTWRGITNSVSSTSTTVSASAVAVKTAYDKGVQALNTANSKLGAGSKAVDSDKLDGLHASSFMRRDAASSTTGRITTSSDIRFTGTGVGSGLLFNSTTISNDAAGIRQMGTNNNGELEFFTTDDDTEPFVFRHYTTGQTGTGASVQWMRVDNTGIFEGNTRLASKYLGKSSKAADSDKLDGLHASAFSRSNHGHTGLEASTWGGLRSRTTHGYVEFGPANTSHAHVYTDRPNFYFNKEILVNGKRVYHTGYKPSKADVGLGNVPNWSSSTFDGRYLGKTSKAVDSDKHGGYWVSQLQPLSSQRNFTSGTLVTTSIDYSVTNGVSFIMHVKGNGYGGHAGLPVDFTLQGYIYYNTIINKGGLSKGRNVSGIVAFNHGGKLCFWWPRQDYWQGFSVQVYNTSQTGVQPNLAVSISNTAKPSGVTKEVPYPIGSVIQRSWNEYTDGSGSGLDADLLDGLHASSFARTSGTYSGLRAQATTKADVGLGSVPNWSSGTFDGRYLGKTANAVSASKWTTAKTLSLTGDVTGSVSWDGSANASITTTVANDSHTHNKLIAIDDRDMKPNTSGITSGNFAIRAFFSSKGGMTGTANSDYHDVLVLDTYSDSSGGGPNAISFDKGNSAGKPAAYLWKGIWGGTTWGTGQRIFADNYHPNADKWTTARTISLAGDASGSVSIDGSSNRTLTVAVANDSHTHDGRYYTEAESDSRFVNVTGDTMTGALVMNNTTRLTSSASDFNTLASTGFYNLYATQNVTNAPPFAYGTMLTIGSNKAGGTFATQLATERVSAGTYVRGMNDGANGWTGWQRLFADNYHPNADKWTTARSHTVTLTGDVTGSATQSVDGTGNKTWTISTVVGNNSHTHDTIDTQDIRYTTKLPSQLAGKQVQSFFNNQTIPTGLTSWYSTLSVKGWGGNYAAWELAGNAKSGAQDGFFFRYGAGSSWSSWQRVFTDNYHPNADKWTTARTLSLAGDATGSVSIDGAANKTLTVTVKDNSHNHAGHDVKVLGHRLTVDSDGKIRANHTDYRRAGMYGTYDSYRIGHIWSMDSRLQIHASGTNFGNLYGLAYKHTNNATGGTMAGGHQMVWTINGTPRAAMGESGLWSAGEIKATGYVRADGGLIQDGHVVLNGSDTWIRTKGADGIFFSTYGGGIRMIDSTWIRTYGGKRFYVENTSYAAINTTGGVLAGKGYRRDNTGSSWISQRDSQYVGLYNETAVSNNAYAAAVRQKHATKTWTVGGLGDQYFGFFSYNNSRTGDGVDGYFRMDVYGNCTTNGVLRAKSTAGPVSRVLTYDDFLPSTPPAGLENTITANWIGAGAINARHLQVNSVVNNGGTYTSFKVAPDATRPLSLSKTDSSGNEVAPIFYVDTKGNGFFDGKLSKDTVDIDSIQEEARKQINPYYIGTVSGSTQTSTDVAMSSGGTHVLATVNVLGGKVNLSWEFSGTKRYFAQGGNQGYTAPTWRVEVFRGSSTSSTRIVNRTYTGSAYNNVEREIGFWDGQASIYINDQFSDITSASSQRYTIRVTRVSGTSTPIKLNRFVGSSPAFKRIEMKYDYTSLYYNASGLGAGNITLSDDYDKYEFLAVEGAEDNDNVMGITLIPTYCIKTDAAKFDNNQFMLSSPGYGRYWRVQLSGKRTLYGRGENSLIRRIWGVNIVEKV